MTVRVALFDCGSRLGVGACIKGRRDAKPLPRDVGENEIRAAVAELVERLHAKH